MLNIRLIIKNLAILQVINVATCSIDGQSYMDPNKVRPSPGRYLPGEDPCHPLYWYPRHIPEYCNYIRDIPMPPRVPVPPLPMPVPVVPSPPMVPVPMPVPSPFPVPVPQQPSYPMPMPFPPSPVLPPYGAPLSVSPPNPMLPVQAYSPYNPLASNPQQVGLVPGLPGLVTRDGGINILPFSDVYSDLLEKHKNRMITRRLQKLIRDYEDFPNRRRYRRLRNYSRRNM